jgi:hypothetical protein
MTKKGMMWVGRAIGLWQIRQAQAPLGRVVDLPADRRSRLARIPPLGHFGADRCGPHFSNGLNNTAIKHIKRNGRGFTNARNYKTRILLRSAARTAA